jgi:hypothetical protein
MSDIRVILKDHSSSKVYTSASPVAGEVTITTKREVRFDSIQIILLGQTKTAFEGISVPQEITHTFLKMMMPIPESTYPVPRVLEPGRTYTIPFNFVIPSQLTINACNHERLSDQLQDHHVLLPPSMGGGWQRDDMAPKMARVEYAVKARVLREDGVGGRKTRIMEATQAIQVLPATAEQPPLNVTEKDRLYRMSKTKTLRRKLLATKLGRLTAEAAQPGAAVLSADGRRVMVHPMARITLTFTPESPRTLPPAITGVTAKLTAHTYFSSGTIADFPNLGEWNQPYGLERRGHFFTSVALPPVALAEQPAWTPVAAPQLTRRDSGYCSTSSDAEDDNDNDAAAAFLSLPSSPGKTATTTSKPKHKTIHRRSTSSTTTTTASSTLSSDIPTHTTTLTIPLALPTDKKTLVPTFHSCIASRVYTAHLTLSLATTGSSSSSSSSSSTHTVSLVVPLQIAVEGFAPLPPPPPPPSLLSLQEQELDDCGSLASGGATGRLPSFEELAADEHLRPRVLRVPAGEFLAAEAGGEARAEWMVRGSATAAVAAVAGGGEEVDDGGLPRYV